MAAGCAQLHATRGVKTGERGLFSTFYLLPSTSLVLGFKASRPLRAAWPWCHMALSDTQLPKLAGDEGFLVPVHPH